MNQITQGILAGIAFILITIGIVLIVKRCTRNLLTTVILQIFVVIDVICFIVSIHHLVRPTLEWLLTGSHPMHFVYAIFVLICINMFIEYLRGHDDVSEMQLLLFVASLILIVLMMAIDGFKTPMYETEQPWKTIYANNIDADVSLSLKNCKSCWPESVDLNKGIGYTYPLRKSKYGTLKLTKGDSFEAREISFNSKNINGTLNEQSKIIKIEYRPITRMRYTLFGFEGYDEQPNVDGEIRITVSEDDHKAELKQLFGD